MKDRRVGVAVDLSPGSRSTLKWAVENVVWKGDHLILVVVQPEENYEQEEMQICGVIGSPLILVKEFFDPTIMKKYRVTPDAETIDIANTAGWDPQSRICLGRGFAASSTPALMKFHSHKEVHPTRASILATTHPS
ncbi:hypothetical protein ACFX13_030583 [Malus domestica]|uniref:uncharacterized protein n=1 Tax=Malus domestica TaxID=3750 RepID=UPI000498B650|nr:uncharacterized protein LOC103424472 [Malus domestica]